MCKSFDAYQSLSYSVDHIRNNKAFKSKRKNCRKGSSFPEMYSGFKNTSSSTIKRTASAEEFPGES